MALRVRSLTAEEQAPLERLARRPRHNIWDLRHVA